ncbi:MAG: hypothetical protein DWI57_06345 [Chloroflexi bacterium]|nr:MAG: hypothetical protein DWI57_06345 [Chloroflexota bacterium]
MTTQRLADYLPYMQTEDVLAATERAKVRARSQLDDQGIVTYDQHYQAIADCIAWLTAADVVNRLSAQ